MSPSKPPRLHNELYATIHPSKLKGSLDSQLVVITGASGTIGQAIAKSFAIAGAVIYLLDYVEAPLDKLKETCLKLGARQVFSARCDVTSFEDCETVVNMVKEDAGPIDVLVNNAGVAGMGLFHKKDPKAFMNTMAVNLNGPYFLMRLVLPDFLARRRGCIINMASRAGTTTGPLLIDYHTSKTALIRLTACVQAEVDLHKVEDVHLYSLHPGAVVSDMSKGAGTPPDLEVQAAFPEVLQKMAEWMPNFKTTPYVSGMTCVALATGIAKKALRGRYHDCTQDLDDIIAQANTLEQDPDLYGLSVKFLGDMPNDGGMENRPGEEPVPFPEVDE